MINSPSSSQLDLKLANVAGTNMRSLDLWLTSWATYRANSETIGIYQLIMADIQILQPEQYRLLNRSRKSMELKFHNFAAEPIATVCYFFQYYMLYRVCRQSSHHDKEYIINAYALIIPGGLQLSRPDLQYSARTSWSIFIAYSLCMAINSRPHTYSAVTFLEVLREMSILSLIVLTFLI